MVCDQEKDVGRISFFLVELAVISNSRGKFKILGLQRHPPPIPFFSGTSWSLQKKNPDEGAQSIEDYSFILKEEIYKDLAKVKLELTKNI